LLTKDFGEKTRQANEFMNVMRRRLVLEGLLKKEMRQLNVRLDIQTYYALFAIQQLTLMVDDL